MKKTHSTIISLVSSLVAMLFGFKLMSFLRVDICLDLGGRVTSWGACEFGGGRAEVISLNLPTLAVVIVVTAIVYYVLNYVIRLAIRHVVKT